jgi:hypothetical protein
MRFNGFVRSSTYFVHQLSSSYGALQRVDRIKSTLSSDLDTLFAATVRTFTDGKEDGKIGKVSESEKARLMTDLVDCLRTYDALGLWRDAEDVLRREVVREFVKQVLKRLRNEVCADEKTTDYIPRRTSGTSVAHGTTDSHDGRLPQRRPTVIHAS